MTTASINRISERPDPLPPNQKLELDVLGMTCGACVRRIETALRKTAGVSQASVNLVTRRATVHYAADLTGPRALAAAVADAGYDVANLAALEGPTALLGRADGATRARVLEEAESAEQRAIRRDFAIAASLTLPLLALAMSHGLVPGSESTTARWLQFALATPVIFGPGRRFLRLAWTALKHRTSDMNTLVSIGALSAWGYSSIAVFAPGLFPHTEHGAMPHLYFEAASAILMFVLLGKLLETRARRRLSEAVRGLAALVPTTARRLMGEQYEEVALPTLCVGDLVLVRPGERVPVDGEVTRGSSALDESMLTGESGPVDKNRGSLVYAGTLNQTGALTFRVTKGEQETVLAGIVEAVEQAQGSRAPIARLADTVSRYFVPIVIAIASVTFASWLAADFSAEGLAIAIERFVAVLVLACPCALGLATPAAVAVGTARGAELGVLVKGGGPLEAASRIDTVLFDKTGTLTRGEPELTDVIGWASVDAGQLLSWIGSVENASEHPVAKAIVRGARSRGAKLALACAFLSEPGHGVQAVVEGRTVRVGTLSWLGRGGVDASAMEGLAENSPSAGARHRSLRSMACSQAWWRSQTHSRTLPSASSPRCITWASRSQW
ncbi:MAG: putative cation-transporting ATPase [Myxococcaceae bacterium]|nr:putative cation-transporting ATPase [Myxococcaceae bacterium]